MSYRLAVMGNPIAHSQSPQIHRQFAIDYGIELSYEKILVPPGELAQYIRDFFAEGGHGLNITLPYKEEAYQLAKHRTERAEFAGAANTLMLDEDRELFADNTDGIGLVNDLHEKKIRIEKHNILLLGAGGASKGIALPLALERPASLTIANRSVNKAEDLAEKLSPYTQVRACSLEELNHNPQAYDLIINATSAGLKTPFFPLDTKLFCQTGSAYDLIYGFDTPFMQLARLAGCPRIFDGYGMLIAQARESFRLWFNV